MSCLPRRCAPQHASIATVHLSTCAVNCNTDPRFILRRRTTAPLSSRPANRITSRTNASPFWLLAPAYTSISYSSTIQEADSAPANEALTPRETRQARALKTAVAALRCQRGAPPCAERRSALCRPVEPNDVHPGCAFYVGVSPVFVASVAIVFDVRAAGLPTDPISYRNRYRPQLLPRKTGQSLSGSRG